MEWKAIKNDSTFYELLELSDKEKVLILKFSPDCMVSFIMKMILQREWNQAMMNIKTYLVDVIDHKDISDKISAEFGVEHQSPQVLIVKNGKCIHVKSHGHITIKDLAQFANK